MPHNQKCFGLVGNCSGSKNRPITLTWNDFLREFADKYTPPVYRNRKKVEFLELKQNELSVAGYELQFVRLSKYAPEEVSTDELRRDRFERGLRLEIREKIAIKPQSYSALLEAALRAEETSLERSSNEAKRKKLVDNLNPSSRQSGAVSFRGSGSQRGWYRGRGVGQTSRFPSVSSSRGGPTSVGFGGRQGPARSFSGRSIPTCANCGRRHTGECWGAQPIVCYRCRQPGHIVRDCPTWRDNVGGSQTSGSSSVGENSQQASTIRGRGRGGRGSGNTSRTSTGQSSQPQPQARVYAITKEQAPTAPRSGYWQLRIEEGSIPKTAFRTRCAQSFEELKRRLTSAPILALPSGDGGYVVYTDASRQGLGCVLMQHGKVIAYASRQLRPHEMNYPTHDLELAAINLTALRAMNVHFSVGGDLLATMQVKPSLKDKIKDAQDKDPYLQKMKTKYQDVSGLETLLLVANNEERCGRICGECLTCQQIKAEHQAPAGKLHPLSIPEWKWEKITMDFVIGLPRTFRKHDAVWVIVDRLTKSAHFLPIRQNDSLDKLAELYVSEIVRLHGIPTSIVSDRDPRFTSHFWGSLHRALGTKLHFSTAFHPQTDGQSERTIQTLEDMMRACVIEFKGNWDDHLPLMEFAYNNSFHSSIGMAPYEALYGRKCRSPICLRD
ncbi:UNVERIFIED_CONTAM: Transposon Ty3-I Gag-Pol polyprotein [Sesamum radiatum]|uniref:Transposon Ty3-I Gag-Pol polyprotein n=1 Tax=Sesamum radiatum TaxID=300843 RepID=A0AAW2S1D9_SESRA